MAAITQNSEAIERSRLESADGLAGNSAQGKTDQFVCRVPDMACADCAARVERAVRDLKGVSEVCTAVVSQKVTVSYELGAIHADEIASAIRDAGYTVKADGDTDGSRSFWRNRKQVLTVLSGALVLAAILTVFLGPEESHVPLWQGRPGPSAIMFLLSAILGGLNFLPAGLRALRALSLDMDFLMAAAILGAVTIGEYMEGAAIASLFSLAGLLEDYAIDRARNSLKALMAFAPETATVLRDGSERVVPVDEVGLDERVAVRPGERIPVDGDVVEGVSAVDQSPITGESMPATKEPGDEVFAGTINREGYLEVRARRLAAESTLSRIIHMVEEAEERRAPSEQFVRRFARVYTPAITLLALGVILLPPLALGADFGTWFLRGLTLLVIACPCALVISTPVAVVSGITSAARNGLLIKGGNYLEALGEIRVVAFDKTGTLTRGDVQVTDVLALDGQTSDEVLRIAAALEQRSQHPIARAIVERASGLELPAVTEFESITGKGVRARIGQTTYAVGKPDLFPNGNTEAVVQLRREGKTAVLVGSADEVIGAVAVADTIREEARETVAALRRQGIEKVVMLTGDNEVTARAIAGELGIDEWRAGLLPEDKVNALDELSRRYGKVAMVGDGVNDAPALAAASVGIAMGAAGSDVALETADVALMADDLSRLPYLFRLSRASRRVIRQNVVAAILVKTALTVGVFPGLVSLVVAVLVGDMGTSLGVTANALRLARLRTQTPGM